MRALSPYWRLARSGFAQQARYLLAAAAGLFTNVVFGFLKSAVLLATVAAAGGVVGGYDRGQMSAYVWISQGLLGSVLNLSSASEFSERVKSGDITSDFLRPVDVQLAHLSTGAGRAVFNLIPRGLPSVLIGLVFAGMTMPSDPSPYLLGMLSLLLAILISGATVFIVEALSFWLVETRGILTFYSIVSTFLAGLFVPVALFPGWLQTLVYATPFPSMLMTPIDLFTGAARGGQAGQLLGAQLFWLVVTIGIGQLLIRAGRRKLEVQGG